MKIQRIAWLMAGVALMVAGCREEGRPERERKPGEVETPRVEGPMTVQDKQSFVSVTRERLDGMSRTISTLETDLEQRMKAHTERARARADEAKSEAEKEAEQAAKKTHDAWDAALDDAKEVRADIAEELDQLGKASDEEFGRKRGELDSRLRDLETSLNKLADEMRGMPPGKAPEQAPEKAPSPTPQEPAPEAPTPMP